MYLWLLSLMEGYTSAYLSSAGEETGDLLAIRDQRIGCHRRLNPHPPPPPLYCLSLSSYDLSGFLFFSPLTGQAATVRRLSASHAPNSRVVPSDVAMVTHVGSEGAKPLLGTTDCFRPSVAPHRQCFPNRRATLHANSDAVSFMAASASTPNAVCQASIGIKE